MVLHAVRDDLDDPLAVVLKNKRHEAKLRHWSQMDITDKWVLQGLGGVLEARATATGCVASPLPCSVLQEVCRDAFPATTAS